MAKKKKLFYQKIPIVNHLFDFKTKMSITTIIYKQSNIKVFYF